MRPRIIQQEGQSGFYWTTAAGTPIRLPALAAEDPEADRLIATHLSALDDALIIAAGRFGEILGGGRRPADVVEREALLDLHRVLDRLVLEFAVAADQAGIGADERAGKIIGTAALFSIRARQPLDLLGPAPLDGELDDPGLGVLGGFGEMSQVDPQRPWLGGRWVLRAEDGRRFPLTLAMMLFDSSGVNKEAAEGEHLEAVQAVIDAARSPQADQFAVACALDWLLYDWLMAHRDGPDSAEIVFAKGRQADAVVVVAAAAASVAARASFDPGLMAPR